MTFNLRLIPLLPFLGAAILMLFGRKWAAIRWSWWPRAPSPAPASWPSTRSSPRCRGRPAGGLHDTVGTWISAGTLKIDLAFRMDGLSGLLCLIITFIGFLIHIYRRGTWSTTPTTRASSPT